jgi:hypothetical protein
VHECFLGKGSCDESVVAKGFPQAGDVLCDHLLVFIIADRHDDQGHSCFAPSEERREEELVVQCREAVWEENASSAVDRTELVVPEIRLDGWGGMYQQATRLDSLVE